MTISETNSADLSANQLDVNFKKFGLRSDLLVALKRNGIISPTPIQSLAIPSLIIGRDMVGLAQTGSGKTVAFLVPILNQLGNGNAARPNQPPRALILAPTRELTNQITQNIRLLTIDLNLRHLAVYGGTPYDKQIRSLKRGVDIVVATPGRLEDLINRHAFNPSGIKHFVLDEGDHMLDLGFYPAIKRITSLLPNNRQTMLFSATMPEEIKTLARKFLSDPVHVQAPQEGVTADKIEQQVTLLDENEKRDHLSNLLRIGDVRQALVFVRTKRRADSLTKFMQVRGFQVDSLHGDMRQSQRQKVLKQFRSGDLRALIATDVAARGIDITNLSHVINFDLSDTPESYIHRVGRTGRAGLGGVALSFCSKTEQAKLAAIISRVGAVLKIFLPDGSIVKNFQPSNSEKALRRKSNFTSQRYRKSGGGKHASALKSRPLDNKGSVVHNRNKKKDQSKKQKNKIKKLKLARNLSQNRSRLSTGPLFPDRPNFGDKTPKSQSRKRTSQNGKTQKVTNGNRKTKIKKIFRSERPRAIEGNSRLKRR